MTRTASHRAMHVRTAEPTEGLSYATWMMSLLIAFALVFFVATTVTLSTSVLVLTMLGVSALTRFVIGALVRA